MKHYALRCTDRSTRSNVKMWTTVWFYWNRTRPMLWRMCEAVAGAASRCTSDRFASFDLLGTAHMFSSSRTCGTRWQWGSFAMRSKHASPNSTIVSKLTGMIEVKMIWPELHDNDTLEIAHTISRVCWVFKVQPALCNVPIELFVSLHGLVDETNENIVYLLNDAAELRL